MLCCGGTRDKIEKIILCWSRDKKKIKIFSAMAEYSTRGLEPGEAAMKQLIPNERF